MVREQTHLHDRAMPDVAASVRTASDASLGRFTSVNPVSRRAGHDQGQLRSPVGAILTIGGQGSVDARGRLLHEGDTAAQLALALANLTEVVLAAGMGLSDLACLRIHTTDVAALLDVYFVVTDHLAEQGATPPVSILEVSRLAIPGMDLEIEGLAVCPLPPAQGNPA